MRLRVFTAYLSAAHRRTLVVLGVLGSTLGCGASPYESTTALRGIAWMNIKRQVGTRVENFSVANDQYTSRNYLPNTVDTPSNMTRIPDDLWQEIDAVRVAWCAELPAAKQTRRVLPTDVGIAFRCDRPASPSFYLPVDALPPALIKLMNLLPPRPPRRQCRSLGACGGPPGTERKSDDAETRTHAGHRGCRCGMHQLFCHAHHRFAGSAGGLASPRYTRHCRGAVAGCLSTCSLSRPTGSVGRGRPGAARERRAVGADHGAGTMGTLELRGPLLGMTVYPAGVVLKPIMLAANALPRATIAAIRVTPGLGGSWVEITHHAPTLATPIAVRLGTHDPVLSILTTWAGEDGRA